MFGALLTNLSKAFDCLNYHLLIAKLNAHGFCLPAVRLVPDCLINRKERTRKKQFIQCIIDGSILCPLLFNIFPADLFFIVNSMDIANYADDNTPYATANNINRLLASLEEAWKTLFTWFDNNLMKSNTDKCQLWISSNEKVTSDIRLYKKSALMNTFFKSPFNYCPLIWMYHSRKNNNKINRLHEKCLRIIYNDKRSSF